MRIVNIYFADPSLGLYPFVSVKGRRYYNPTKTSLKRLASLCCKLDGELLVHHNGWEWRGA